MWEAIPTEAGQETIRSETPCVRELNQNSEKGRAKGARKSPQREGAPRDPRRARRERGHKDLESDLVMFSRDFRRELVERTHHEAHELSEDARREEPVEGSPEELAEETRITHLVLCAQRKAQRESAKNS